MQNEPTHTEKPTAEPLQARVEALVEEVLRGTPHFVVEAGVRGTPGSHSVTVFLDSDAALGADELARLHRELAFVLDAEEVFPRGYGLTVSTPGTDRPLRLPRQFQKNVGRMLRAHHRRDDGQGHTETVGVLEAADDDGFVLVPKKGEPRRLHYADVVWAKVQLPW